MTSPKTITAVLLASALLGVGNTAGGQQAATPSKPVHKTTRKHRRAVAVHKETATEAQVRELREQMLAQQAQLDALKSQMAARDQQLTSAQQATTDAQTQAAQATVAATQASSAAAESSSKVDTLQNTVTDLKATDAGLTETVVRNQQQVEDQINSPTTLHYKGLTITPVAFFALEGVYRQHSVNSDINTPFNSIPFPAANEGHTSELNFSGRQSRLGGLFEGDAGTYKLSGYFEADFLSSGTTSNDNQSNSYTLRQRQIWGKAENSHGFAVTGGQMWSLVTEDGKSTNARTEKLPNTIDPQYMVGFNWTRQPGIRLQQRFGDPKTGAFTLAMSLENAQITNFTATSATSGAVPTNFYFGGTGQNGGLYNAFNGTYANNVAPDVIVKGALDFSKAHIEFGGIARFLRDYYHPITATTVSSAGAITYTLASNTITDTKSAGGVFGSVRVSPVKFFDVAFQGMAGDGTGRYGSSQLADATVHPTGTLEPLRNYHGLFSLETHPARKLDVYAYYGGEYAQRTVYATSTGALIGYGAPNLSDANCYALPSNPGSSTGGSPSSPAGCNSPTRYIQEGMFGFTYRAINSPKYGRLQYQLTYSYLQRNLWSGVGSTTTPSGPRAADNMIHAGMRYYIP